jgi:hypothetical protein
MPKQTAGARKATAKQAAKKLDCTLKQLVFEATREVPDSDDPEISRRVYRYSLGVLAESRQKIRSRPPRCRTRSHARPHVGGHVSA